MKNCKTFYEDQTASNFKEIVQPSQTRSHQNLTTPLEQKISYGDIQKCTDICFQSASRIQFLEVKKWCSANAFSDTR